MRKCEILIHGATAHTSQAAHWNQILESFKKSLAPKTRPGFVCLCSPETAKQVRSALPQARSFLVTLFAPEFACLHSAKGLLTTQLLPSSPAREQRARDCSGPRLCSCSNPCRRVRGSNWQRPCCIILHYMFHSFHLLEVLLFQKVVKHLQNAGGLSCCFALKGTGLPFSSLLCDLHFLVAPLSSLGSVCCTVLGMMFVVCDYVHLWVAVGWAGFVSETRRQLTTFICFCLYKNKKTCQAGLFCVTAKPVRCTHLAQACSDFRSICYVSS